MNADCPPGQICENERCTEQVSGCRDDSECGPNADCIDGACVAGGPCADCPEDTRCINDMCVPIERCNGDGIVQLGRSVQRASACLRVAAVAYRAAETKTACHCLPVSTLSVCSHHLLPWLVWMIPCVSATRSPVWTGFVVWILVGRRVPNRC